MEYIQQDQPWTGFHATNVGAVPRADHNEVETTNLSWKWLAEIGISEKWSLGISLPLLYREHLHLASEHADSDAEDQGSQVAASTESSEGLVTIGDATGVPQRWEYARIGDAQVTASYTLLSDRSTWSAIYIGLKVPTGDTGVRNSAGEEAELTLQPGTGSFDPVFGLRLQHLLTGFGTNKPVPLSFAAHVRTEGSNGKFGYRPGTEAIMSAGIRYPLWEKLHPALQLNFRYRDRDHVGGAPGVPAEHTGSEALYVSPGAWLALTESLGAHGFIQVPVVQRVNGIQIVSRWNLLIGFSYNFNI